MGDLQDIGEEIIAEAAANNPQPPKRRKRRAADVLLELAMAKAMDKKTLRGLADRTIRALVVEIPDASWGNHVSRHLRDLLDSAVHSIVRTEAPKSYQKADADLAPTMRSGTTVIGISQSPDRMLPPLLLRSAQAHVTIEQPDAAMLAKVIRASQRGRVPERIHQIDLRGFKFDEITSVLVPGGFAGIAVERLETAVATRAKVGKRTDRLPRLEDATEFGEARQWALDLRDDLADVRAGKITYQETDKGAILYGPPGTGKTLLARMIGEALQIPTIVTSVAEWFASGGGYLHEIIRAQRQVFEEARSKAPCVLFLDEINMMPNMDQLGGSKNKDYWAPVVLDFYQLLDGATEGRDGVIVIGATNRVEDINPAILRPGRCERTIYIGPPDAGGVGNILRHHLGDDLRGADLTSLAMLNAARQTTGAVVMEQVRAARRIARRAGRPLSIEDLQTRIIGDDTRHGNERYRAAIHEAGHAIAAREYEPAKLQFVTIAANGRSGGSTSFETEARSYLTVWDYEAIVVALLAGRAAEHVVFDTPSHGAGGGESSDLGKATRLLASMQTSMGLGDSLVYLGDDNAGQLLSLDPQLRAKVDRAIRSLYDRAFHLINGKKDLVLALADALMERQFLGAEEVESIIAERESRPVMAVEMQETGIVGVGKQAIEQLADAKCVANPPLSKM